MVSDSKSAGASRGAGRGAGSRLLGVRSTAQKRALADVLAESEAFRSAQELHATLRSRGVRIGLTTVYNQLRALCEAGELDVTRAGDGETLYRRCASERHHHHLVCRACGRTVEVEGGAAVESWARRVGAEAGFVDVTHTIEVVGTCAACAAGARARAGRRPR